MTAKAKEVKALLEKCYLWNAINKAFNDAEAAKQGTNNNVKGRNATKKQTEMKNMITDELIEMYVYVLDAEGPEQLAALKNQYIILKEISDHNCSKYKDVFDNVEAFLRKLLYIVDPQKLEEFTQEEHNGLFALCTKINLMDTEYYQNYLLRTTFQKVIDDRNENTHWAPLMNINEVVELVWQSLFVELWAVSKYQHKLEKEKNMHCKEEYEEIAKLYREVQIKEYEKIEKSRVKYIQIEYENTKDPDNLDYSEKDSDDADTEIEVVKGTAATLMRSIDFAKTPSIKLIAEAGMGKTRMLEYINYMIMKDGASVDGKEVFPLLIYCNDTTGDLVNYRLESTILAKLHKFLNREGLENVSIEGFFNYLSDEYKIMFLLDGLNEITKDESGKSLFVKSLNAHINTNAGKKYYYLITERYARGATTVQNNVIFYKLSEITDEIKRQFFKEKGDAGVLFERLKLILDQYSAETRAELNELLRRPFYLIAFCELADNLKNIPDAKLPKDKIELMDYFVKELIKRENVKGESAAKFMYIKFYLEALAGLLPPNHCIKLEDLMETFANVTSKKGLGQEYASNRILELFQQLGFICCTDESVYVNDIYAEYMEAIALGII